MTPVRGNRVLEAYADESGHFADPRCRYVGMAGLVAEQSRWESFRTDWKNVLDRYIPGHWFHMKQFVGMKGPYKDWSEDRRRDFLAELIGIIVALEATKVGCVVSVGCFKQLPPRLQNFFDEPYFMACQQVIRGCGICGLAIEGPNDRVHFTIAEQLEYGAVGSGTFVQDQAGKVHKLWKAVKEMTDFGPPLATYRAGSPRSIEALQAADLFAYELVKEYESREAASTRPMRWALRQILNDTLWSSSLLKFYSLDTMLLTLMENGVIPNDKEIHQVSAHIQLANKFDMHMRSHSK